MKKNIFALMLVISMLTACQSTIKQEPAVTTFHSVIYEAPLKEMANEGVILEVITLDDLTVENSHLIYENDHLIDFYSVRKVKVHQVFLNNPEIKIADGDIIHLVEPIAITKDNRIYESYEGQLNSNLQKDNTYLVYLKHFQDDWFGLYHAGKAKFNQKVSLWTSELGILSSILFYSTNVKLNPQVLITARNEGILEFTTPGEKILVETKHGDFEIVHHYMAEEDKTYFEINGGNYLVGEGKLIP